MIVIECLAKRFSPVGVIGKAVLLFDVIVCAVSVETKGGPYFGQGFSSLKHD